MLRHRCYAPRAAAELTSGVAQLPDAERDSEWAADLTIAAEAYADSGDPERAVDEARRALAVNRQVDHQATVVTVAVMWRITVMRFGVAMLL